MQIFHDRRSNKFNEKNPRDYHLHLDIQQRTRPQKTSSSTRHSEASSEEDERAWVHLRHESARCIMHPQDNNEGWIIERRRKLLSSVQCFKVTTTGVRWRWHMHVTRWDHTGVYRRRNCHMNRPECALWRQIWNKWDNIKIVHVFNL